MRIVQININSDKACQKCGHEGIVNDTRLCMECIGKDAAQLLHLDVRMVKHKGNKTVIEYREKGTGGSIDIYSVKILEDPSKGFLESLIEIGTELWTYLDLKNSLILAIDIEEVILKESDTGDQVTVKGVALGKEGGVLLDIKGGPVPLVAWPYNGVTIDLLMTRAARFVVNRQSQADLFEETEELEEASEAEVENVLQQTPAEPTSTVGGDVGGSDNGSEGGRKGSGKSAGNPAGVTMLDKPLPGSEAEAGLF